MDIYRVTFLGHRRISAGSMEADKQIEQIARDLILQKEYVEFYVGRNGDFDILAASAIKRAQKSVGTQNSSLILALPYPVKDLEYYKNYYDEILFPVDPKTHFKAAITKRNQWMIQNSDLFIAFVQENKGNSYLGMKYAEKIGIQVINLGIEN